MVQEDIREVVVMHRLLTKIKCISKFKAVALGINEQLRINILEALALLVTSDKEGEITTLIPTNPQ